MDLLIKQMKKIFVTINLGGSIDDDVPYRIPSRWRKVVFTDYPHLYPEFDCIPVIDNGYSNAVVSKQIKWHLAEMFCEYDIIVYADRNIAVGNLDNQIADIDFEKFDMALIKHRLSKSIADEIELCKKTNRWSDEFDEYLKLIYYSGFDICKSVNIYANGIMIFSPTDNVRDIHSRVSWAMKYANRDQVIFPIFNSNEEIKIQELNWSTFNNKIFKTNTFR